MAAPVKKSKKKGIPPQMQRGFSKKNVGMNVPKGKGGKPKPVKPKAKGGPGKAQKKQAKGGKAITNAAASRGMKRTTTKKDLSFNQMAGGGGKRKSAYYGGGAMGRIGATGKVGGPGHKGMHSKQGSKTLSRSQPSRTQIMLNSNEKRGSVLHLFNSGKNKKKKSKK